MSEQVINTFTFTFNKEKDISTQPYADFQRIASSVQSLSRVRLFVTPWIAARQASLSIINSWSSLRLMSIESVMPSSHLILCCPLLLLPPIPPSIRVFSSESTLRMKWPKYWSFSFSIIHVFKKIRDTKGTFHAKMDTIKDRNGLDLTEAEDRRGGKNIQTNYTQKICMTQITMMVWSLTFLECEVKWALRSITKN